MEASVFLEIKFWLLILLSIVVPAFMYLLQLRKSEATPLYVVTFGLALTAISGVDVYLLQTLAAASSLTPSLADNAIFNSEISFSLYVLPVLFGGIGINLVSDGLLVHLMSAETRYEGRRVGGTLSSLKDGLSQTRLQGLRVQLPEAATANNGVVLPFAGQRRLHGKVNALLECLKPNAAVPGIPLQELFSPTFVAAHTSFATIEDMFEAGGLSPTSQEDCNQLSRQAWNEFVRSTTRHASWEGMLQSAYCHWMAGKLVD